MEHITSDNSQETIALVGATELWDRLDRLARATLGVGAAEFAEGYPLGRFSRTPVATDLAALLPFVERQAHS
jgi:hypothetical protein